MWELWDSFPSMRPYTLHFFTSLQKISKNRTLGNCFTIQISLLFRLQRFYYQVQKIQEIKMSVIRCSKIHFFLYSEVLMHMYLFARALLSYVQEQNTRISTGSRKVLFCLKQ